jgi:hypothetical protein
MGSRQITTLLSASGAPLTSPGSYSPALTGWPGSEKSWPEPEACRVIGHLDADRDVVAMALAEPGRAEHGAGAVIPGYGHVSMVFVHPDLWDAVSRGRRPPVDPPAVRGRRIRLGHPLPQARRGT